MIAVLTPCLFYGMLVRALNCVSKSAAKTVFGHLNQQICPQMSNKKKSQQNRLLKTKQSDIFRKEIFEK